MKYNVVFPNNIGIGSNENIPANMTFFYRPPVSFQLEKTVPGNGLSNANVRIHHNAETFA